MRLIDVDELYAHKFKSASERMDLSVEYMGGWNDAIDAIIENAPTIEAEPVRHGHWTRIGTIENTWSVYECSFCRYHTIDNGLYCTNCSAKMDEVEKMNNAELLDKLKEMINELQNPCEDCQEFDCSECNIKADYCPLVSSLKRWQNE